MSSVVLREFAKQVSTVVNEQQLFRLEGQALGLSGIAELRQKLGLIEEGLTADELRLAGIVISTRGKQLKDFGW